MSRVEGSQLRSVGIEIRNAGYADSSSAVSHASVEFVRTEALREGEAVQISFAVSEFSLADLVGTPQLLETRRLPDGSCEFRYSLQGAMQAHGSRE